MAYIKIFGSGEVGKALKKNCGKLGIEIDGFIDSNNLNDLKEKDDYFFIATGDVKMVNNELLKLGYKKEQILNRLTAKILEKTNFAEYDDYAVFCIKNCIDCNRNYKNDDFLRSLDLVITTRCPLKCKDCSNLMQYYKTPQDYKPSQIRKWMRALLSNYDIGELRFIGGEPFMNKEWHIILNYLIKEPRIKRIIIYTNGTILPEIKYLKNDKVLVMVTDYGKLSRNKEKLVYSLEENGIFYKVIKPEWTDCGSIKKHKRTPKQNLKIYTDCCARNSTLLEGKLYPCAFMANLSKIKSKEITNCDYCNGRPRNAKHIVSAIQKENN